jgi:hypothetical protein
MSLDNATVEGRSERKPAVSEFQRRRKNHTKAELRREKEAMGGERVLIKKKD